MIGGLALWQRRHFVPGFQEKCGLLAVADELQLDLLHPESGSFSPTQMDGKILKNWSFFEAPFQRAKKVIGLAPCKDHKRCHASMTMKNWHGLLGGLNKVVSADCGHVVMQTFF